MNASAATPAFFTGFVRVQEGSGGSGSAWVPLRERVSFTEAKMACEKHLFDSPDDGHQLQFQVEDDNGERMAVLNPPHSRWLSLQEPASEDSQILRSVYSDMDLLRIKVNVAVALAGIAAIASVIKLVTSLV